MKRKERKRRIVYLERLRAKIIVLIVSLIVDAVIVLLYFIDPSLVWEAEVIASCILVCLYMLLVVPSVRYFFIWLKNFDLYRENRNMFYFAWYAIRIAILLPPYYAVKYYFEC